MNAISETIVTFLINSAVHVAVVAVIALLCSVALRRVAAKYRYALWIASLLLASLLPLWSVRLAISRIVGGGKSQKIVSSDQSQPAVSADSNIDLGLSKRLSKLREETIPFPPIVAASIATLYGLLLALRSARLWMAWRQTRTLYNLAASGPSLEILQPLIEHRATKFGRKSPPRIYALDGVGPLTLGTRHPILVMPKAFLETASATDLDAAICHELAHIVRKDFAANLLCEIVSLPVSIHPLMWWMKFQVRRTRELACDDLAAEVSSTPTRYASALVHVAQSLLPNPRTSQPQLAQGLFDTDDIERRVGNLLNRQRLFGRTAGRVITVTAVGCVAGIAFVASTFSVRLASSQTIASAAPVLAQSYHAENASRPRVRVSKISFVESTPSIDEAEIQSFAKQIEEMKTLNQSMDWAEEVQERTRNFWQNYGYFKVNVADTITLVSSSSAEQVFSVVASIEPGNRYRFGGLAFTGAKVFSTNELEAMFPISHGDIFNRSKIASGLENLRSAYGAHGLDESWFVPTSEFDESDKTITLRILVHEGSRRKD
jgi:beta-lactamase regulating signal transducer with metallopeptidase domain